MKAIDTNVLVRFLVADDPSQAEKAKALVDQLDADDERGYISDVVLCELVWVLGRTYRYARAEIIGVVKKLVAARQLRFDSLENILRALSAFEKGGADFADYLIREHARSAGCNVVVTFDSRLLAEEMFTSP